SGELTRGASDNASGVAVLLDLAQRFTHDRRADADVWLVATGSKETWLSGMRRLLATHRFGKANTQFLNIDHVGSDELHYVTSEGMLMTFASNRDMTAAARAEAEAHHAAPLVWQGLPSDAFLPLVRGYRAMSITAVGGKNAYDDDSDRAGAIDYATVTAAASYAESIIRRL